MPERIEDRRCSDAYVQDMARYSIITNWRRNIPDLKDGLKPVQRRIVYAMMHDEHAVSQSTKVKCSAIIGTVMKLYHPHGDCLHSDTPVCGTSGKIYTIGELYTDNVQSLEILSVDQKTGNIVHAIAHSFRIGQYTDAIYHIGLSNGTEIKCTGNHPFLTADMNWIKAENISPDTRLFQTTINYNYTIPPQPPTNPVWIEKVTIERVSQEPMYDFTVDNYENMIIPIPAIKYDDNQSAEMLFICAHNSSIYDAMKPLANWFECKMPLIRPGGSFGNIMGGSASAPRYTEANLTPFALECVLSGLNTSNALVDWVDNYDNKRKEPEYLPATIPLLLVNGMTGMGVGLSVDLPQHNLGEVIDATLRLMDNPNAPVVLIPDHCIPCEIIDTDWKAICNSGSGSYRARGFIDIEEGKSGPVIIIKSIPTYNTSVVYRQLNELIKKGKFPQITRVRDESAKGVIRIVINLRKGSDASFVKEAIYKYTRCEDSFRINFEVIEGIELMRMSYKGYLEAFIQFAMTNKFRYCYNQLTTINTRMHKLEAFIKVLRSGYIDDIIKMIRKRKESDDNSIIEFIISKAGVTDLQASFIINANIKNLSLGYLIKYETEYKALKEQMSHYEAFVSNDDLIKNSVRQDLLDAKAKYATPRLCKVIKASSVGNIPQGSFKVIITENNYIRKIGINDIVNVVRGDKPKFIMDVENTENVLLFDNKGRVFKLPVHKVPIIGKSDPGFDIKTIIRGLTADIICMMYEPWLKNTTKIKQKFYLSIITRHNVIKKLDINDFLSVPPSGIIYSKLNLDDTVISIQIISDQLDVVIYSGHKALRMSAKEIPCYKRNTLGIAAMNTNDPIEGMSIIYPEATDIVVATVSGKFNRFLASGLARSNRNKAGSSVIKLAKGDRIQSIYGVSELNILEVTTTSDVFRIPINTIQSGSSVSPGVKMISTKSDTIIRAQVVPS